VAVSIWIRGELSGNDWFEVCFIGFAQAVLFLHLAVYLSLVLKYGAILAALALMFVGETLTTAMLNFLFAFLLGSGNETVIIFFGAIPLVIAAVLHRQIGRRLAKVAANE